MNQLQVLVVDDDDAVREVAREMLDALGCSVTCANGGKQAIELAEAAASRTDPFALIFLDIGMPGMTGVEVHQKLRSSLPEQKIVFMTGFAEDDLSESKHAATWILLKPFSLGSLTDLIEQAR